MHETIQPMLQSVKIMDLRPTQMTVGMSEVDKKRKIWRKRSKNDESNFLGNHMIPCVRGPKDNLWIIDHHHLALALYLESEEFVLVSIIADLSKLDKKRFVHFMDNRNWLHTYDAQGEKQDFDALPKKVTKLQDDPYRSLAGAVREAGGYSKDTTPYSEFLWADYFRAQFNLKPHTDICDDDLHEALARAHSKNASYLPGWCGVESND